MSSTPERSPVETVLEQLIRVQSRIYQTSAFGECSYLSRVSVNGVSLSYTDSGKGEPIILVHGIAEDYRAWNLQVEEFSSGHRVIAYSRRMSQPNGNDPDCAESTIANNERDLLGLIEELRAFPATLVGHSYGSHIAAYLALQNPGLVRRLVLVEPGIPTVSPKDPKSVTGLFSTLIAHPVLALSGLAILADLASTLAKYHLGDLDGALAAFLDGIQARKGALESFPEPARTMMEQNVGTIGELEARNLPLTEGDPADISVPTLLVKGTTDNEFMMKSVDLMSQIIPKSSVVAIPNSGHFPHIENPRVFNQKVSEFLTGR